MATTNTYTWWKVKDQLPPAEKLVKTKYHDEEKREDMPDLYYKDGNWWGENDLCWSGEPPTHWTYRA